jgi:uncharacterized secreted repeat protein (TIGR03808 family)
VRDQTVALQAALSAAARTGAPLLLPAGTFLSGRLELPAGLRMVGSGPRTVLQFSGAGGAFLTARNADDISLEDLSIDGAGLAIKASEATGLLDARDCGRLSISGVEVRRGLVNAISLVRCSGRVSETRVSNVSQTGIFSLDAAGLEISHCQVLDCGNNGIQVWRETVGDDGTLVTSNRIERIAAKGGGSGEYGNGVNVFRAGGVLVSGNRITDCAYSAVRGNAASDIQMVGNSCARLGEVALYAEFAFEGALIANNLVDGAASGIAVTNFNEGGRLAVIQGNLIRNLRRREQEPVDKRGEGISVEADAVVSGNVIEKAPSFGIVAGWGKHLRNVVVTGNLIRDAGVGIAVSASQGAGSCLISQNMISGAMRGAIQSMDHDRVVDADLIALGSKNPRLAVSGNVVT